MNSMQWADVMPNPAKDNFYNTCVQTALYPEGDIEGIEEIDMNLRRQVWGQ